jgi:hypothetical protein
VMLPSPVTSSITNCEWISSSVGASTWGRAKGECAAGWSSKQVSTIQSPLLRLSFAACRAAE